MYEVRILDSTSASFRPRTVLMRNLALIETRHKLCFTFIYGTRISIEDQSHPLSAGGGMEPTPSTAKNHVLLYFYSSIVFYSIIDEHKSCVRLECISM